MRNPRVLCNIYGNSPSGLRPRARACILHKTRGFLMLYVFYITMTPYLPCNNNNINRKELYDFYYTAITLTTGYKCTYYKHYTAHVNRKVLHTCTCSANMLWLCRSVLVIKYRQRYLINHSTHIVPWIRAKLLTMMALPPRCRGSRAACSLLLPSP